MSNTEGDEACASCGKAAVDEVKLMFCAACKLVKYCSVECQKNHRKQHKKACKKRAAELRDDRLFTQPDESHWGECQICCLPLPIDHNTRLINPCCCKRICRGCDYADFLREEKQGMEQRCPYCREVLPETGEEINQEFMKRVKANDPIALYVMGQTCDKEGDHEGAFQYFTKAAALGDIDAHYDLAVTYRDGDGVGKDLKKELHHLEEAAIGGHPLARYNLGANEWNSGRYDRSLKHYIIAANLGLNDALEMVKNAYQYGDASKEDYEAALRGHQAAVDATKSKQREEAYAFHNLSPE